MKKTCRYDHFLQLCELLPQAIPSLVFNLQTVKYGTLSKKKISEINNDLGCNWPAPWTLGEVESTGSMISCNFTGNGLYKTVLSLMNILPQVKKDYENAQKYMSPMNMKYNYIHKARADEILPQLELSYQNLIRIKDDFIQYGKELYWDETINEWLLVYLLPHIEPVYEIINTIKQNRPVNAWKPRPLNITLKDYPQFVN